MKSAIFNIHAVFNLIVLVEILFLCFIIKMYSHRNRDAHNALLAILLTIAGVTAGNLLVWNDFFRSHLVTSITTALLSVSLLLQGPALLAYLHKTTYGVPFKRLYTLLHLLPALIAGVLILSFNISNEDWQPHNWHTHSSEKYLALQIVWWLFKCVPVLYIGLCWHIELQARKKMRNTLSSISQLDIRLMDLILIGFFSNWLGSFLGFVFGNYFSTELNETIGLLNSYIVIILVNVLLVFWMKNVRELLGGYVEASVDPSSPQDVAPAGTAPSEAELEKDNRELTQKDFDSIALIDRTIAEKKPYLDSRLNLDRFAELCGLRPRDVSFLLNSHYKKNFHEFINELRIEEVKQLLATQKHKAILEMAMECGFNSHSAFQRFFKRFVGMSPSEYRKLDNNSL